MELGFGDLIKTDDRVWLSDGVGMGVGARAELSDAARAAAGNSPRAGLVPGKTGRTRPEARLPTCGRLWAATGCAARLTRALSITCPCGSRMSQHSSPGHSRPM